eukprot:gnl/TRDRNA2_/TRDRNA2_187457_c0_seq1.p1 gnl/TRDRNA2_/TRDRNA2_187457_c0~~gnl/TRDRNA2_/TRDRNA2_187457_c0_seq1.p1  ORF type:complete len:100 (-),score=23.59 gnl/TRDRNA2_/TRDRNA2_187457_c0_seq1:60-317(-)
MAALAPIFRDKNKDEDADEPLRVSKERRPKTLIDPNKERRVMMLFSGLGSDMHKDVMPEIAKYRCENQQGAADGESGALSLQDTQ